MIDMDAKMARIRANRAARGLISNSGIACPTREFVEYYNARDAAADSEGRTKRTPELAALKAAAVASIKRADE